MISASVPFMDLTIANRELEAEFVDVLQEALRSSTFIGGRQVEAFEEEYAAYCGTTHCVGVASGTDALRFALIASGVANGDAVLTVSHTFIATVEAIRQAGAEPEFVDIDDHTYNMSPAALAEYLDACVLDTTVGRPLGRRTGRPIKAVVPVHLYGQMADMTAILKIADRHGLIVIEDACQAHGAQYLSGGDWRRAGSIGAAAAFSFYPGKNLGACGEAGAVTTSDGNIADKVRMLRDHGQLQKYHHVLEGYNGRLDAIQAGFLRLKLRRLDSWNSERRAIANRYRDLLSRICRDRNAPRIIVPFEPHWSAGVYHLYVIRTGVRAGLADHLRLNGIHTALHYPVPIHLQPCYREWAYGVGTLPVTERVAREILSLPLFPGLTQEQQGRVVSEIEAFIGSRAAVRNEDSDSKSEETHGLPR